jgi:hypothetical protein
VIPRQCVLLERSGPCAGASATDTADSASDRAFFYTVQYMCCCHGKKIELLRTIHKSARDSPPEQGRDVKQSIDAMKVLPSCSLRHLDIMFICLSYLKFYINIFYIICFIIK